MNISKSWKVCLRFNSSGQLASPLDNHCRHPGNRCHITEQRLTQIWATIAIHLGNHEWQSFGHPLHVSHAGHLFYDQSTSGQPLTMMSNHCHTSGQLMAVIWAIVTIHQGIYFCQSMATFYISGQPLPFIWANIAIWLGNKRKHLGNQVHTPGRNSSWT